MTPVQFDDTFEILNQINKIYIADEARLSLDAMQVCKNPVGKGHPIIGKFCKEDQHGALSVHKLVKEITDFEYYLMRISKPPMFRPYTFAQKVYGVIVKSWNRYPDTEYNYWSTPTQKIIKILPFWTHFWLPFEGETIWFSTKAADTRGDIYIWGFY